MLTIKNLYKLIAEDVIVSKNGANEFWVVNDLTEMPGVYDIQLLRKMGIFDTIERIIRIQREQNELGMYSVQIIQNSMLIDKDQLRVRNIQTAEGMLGELKTIMEFV